MQVGDLQIKSRVIIIEIVFRFAGKLFALAIKQIIKYVPENSELLSF